MFFGLSRYSTIEEIRGYAKTHHLLSTEKKKRSTVNLCVIDDEHFAPKSNLESYGYIVDDLKDIDSIDRVIEYDIVLCDLMGVGLNFDKNLGGRKHN